jgi:hypothetical protein
MIPAIKESMSSISKLKWSAGILARKACAPRSFLFRTSRSCGQARARATKFVAVIGRLCLLALTFQCTLPAIGLRAQSPAIPASSRAIVPAPKPPATLAELRARIEEICRQPALDPGFFAV